MRDTVEVRLLPGSALQPASPLAQPGGTTLTLPARTAYSNFSNRQASIIAAYEIRHSHQLRASSRQPAQPNFWPIPRRSLRAALADRSIRRSRAPFRRAAVAEHRESNPSAETLTRCQDGFRTRKPESPQVALPAEPSPRSHRLLVNLRRFLHKAASGTTPANCCTAVAVPASIASLDSRTRTASDGFNEAIDEYSPCPV